MVDPCPWGSLGNCVARASEVFCLKGGGAGVFIHLWLSAIGGGLLLGALLPATPRLSSVARERGRESQMLAPRSR